MRSSLHLLAVLFLASSALAPQQAKKPLASDQFAQWQVLREFKISNDGRWFGYRIDLVDGDGWLAFRNVDEPGNFKVESGSAFQFSDDSQWVAYQIGPPKAEADKMREQRKPIELKLIWRNLKSGTPFTLDAIQSMSFTKGGKFLIASGYPAAPPPNESSTLFVIELASGNITPFPGVTTFAVDPSGERLAMSVSASGTVQSLQVLDLGTMRIKPILSGQDKLQRLDWAEKSESLCFIAGRDDPKKEGIAWNVGVIPDASLVHPSVRWLDPTKKPAIPEGFRVVEFNQFGLSPAGDAIVFGVKEWQDKKPPKGKPEEQPGVQVWTTNDKETMPEQVKKAGAERQRADLCVWWLVDDKVVKLGDSVVRNLQFSEDFKFALGQDPLKYATASRAGGVTPADYYRIDATSGNRALVLEKSAFPAQMSPDGNWILYWADGDWTLLDPAKGTKKNLTQSTKTSFVDPDYDGPRKDKMPAGTVMWLKGSEGALIGDEFDQWLLDPARGSLVKLTDGAKSELTYQPIDLDRSDNERPSLQDDLYFSLFGKYTKASGFAVRRPNGEVKTLYLDNVRVGGLMKSKDTDRMLFVTQTFERSPNVFVTNTRFEQAKPLTRTNPQQEDFAWGKTELIEYKSTWGKRLQGILIYPAGYEAGKTYPMVTYIYERLSDGLHQYSTPSNTSAYNVQALSQAGYFVLMPDITYRTREPGISAVNCLEPALDAVITKKVGVDPKKIGLIGHSWGAYQTVFTVTTSKRFAVGVAGAPLTDMVSMYNSFYWNSGTPNQVIFESSQGRFDMPWWQDLKAYMDNSAMFQAAKLNAPLMVAFGDQDGAVDWHQGQYLYNTLRRMGKFMVMLVYAGENHGLAKKPNQIDYATRTRHFLDVYLKGVKPEPWISEGVSYLKQNGG